MNAIEVRELSKSFGDVSAVDDLSFDVPLGRVTGFLGPNGAGKSTTMRAILGLVRPDAGSALVLGKSFSSRDEPAREVGALLGVEQFHPARSGRSHLQVLAAAGRVPTGRVEDVLELVDLSAAAGRKVGGYSLGMKQRLGLAGALLGDPRLLVLDEPANGLDPAGIRWLRGFLKSFASEERAVFVSSHLLAEIAEIADDVIVINRGRFVTHASVVDLTDKAAAGVRVVTPDPTGLERALTAASLEHERVSADAIVVTAGAERVGSLAAAAGIPIFGLEVRHRTLEDVFFDLTDTERSN